MQNSKFLEDKTEENLNDFGYGNDFLDTTEVQFTKEITNKVNLIKILKLLLHTTKRRIRRQAQTGRKCFARYTNDKGSLYKI